MTRSDCEGCGTELDGDGYPLCDDCLRELGLPPRISYGRRLTSEDLRGLDDPD